MKATVKKITEIYRTRMIDDGWEDEYTEGMELLAGEVIEIRGKFIDGKTSHVWFKGWKADMPLGNKVGWFNWHVSWLKDFQE